MRKDSEMEFKKNEHGSNYLLSCDGFYISYNPRPCGGMGLFESDCGSAETALIYNGTFKILNGDFREEFLIAAKSGLDECKKVFGELEKKYKSSWSE